MIWRTKRGFGLTHHRSVVMARESSEELQEEETRRGARPNRSSAALVGVSQYSAIRTAEDDDSIPDEVRGS